MISLRSTFTRRMLSACCRLGLKTHYSGKGVEKIRFLSSKNSTGDDDDTIHTRGSTSNATNSSLQKPAGPLWTESICEGADDEGGTTLIKPDSSEFFIPQVALSDYDGRMRKRVLVLCTGGTLTMAPDPKQGGGK